MRHLFIKLSGIAAVGALALAAGCTTPRGDGPIVVNIHDGGTLRDRKFGGAPQGSVDNCISAAERTFKVPAGSVTVDSGTAASGTGIYDINLKIGPQGRSAVCTVNENGNVSGMVYKRAM